MDNDKTPEYLEKILNKGGYKAVNEDPALDQKKVLAPLKDESTNLPEETRDSRKIDSIREKANGGGRGIGGNTTTNQPEGEYKTPSQKILERGGQIHRNGGSGNSGRGGGSPIIKEPDEMLHEKQDAIDPEDTLSKNQGKKQQKQETQQQQAQHKPEMKEREITQKLSVRERVDKAKEAKEQQVPEVEKTVEVGKEVKQIGIRERIAKAVVEKNNEQVKTPSLKEKSMDVAMNKVEPPSSKSIKR